MEETEALPQRQRRRRGRRKDAEQQQQDRQEEGRADEGAGQRMRPRRLDEISAAIAARSNGGSGGGTTGERAQTTGEEVKEGAGGGELGANDGVNGEQFEYLDHTADVQLHAWAPTLEGAFEQVAVCMFNYMTDVGRVEEDEGCTRVLTIGNGRRKRSRDTAQAEGETAADAGAGGGKGGTDDDNEVDDEEGDAQDVKSLLFRFLHELLFIFATEGLVCCRVEVEDLNLERFSLRARVHGETFDMGKHPQGTEIKAITYSHMQVYPAGEKDANAHVYVIVDI